MKQTSFENVVFFLFWGRCQPLQRYHWRKATVNLDQMCLDNSHIIAFDVIELLAEFYVSWSPFVDTIEMNETMPYTQSVRGSLKS